MMGTGKSTVGRLLADTLGYTLIDLDAEIERMEGRTISEMFEADGEPYFREAESVALRSVLQRKGIIAYAERSVLGRRLSGQLMAALNHRALISAMFKEVIPTIKAEST